MATIKQVDHVRTYYVKGDQWDWGYFFINDRGLFACHTDYGSFGYHWPLDPDFDFLKFLANAQDIDYILRKISRQSEIDAKRTRKAFLGHISELRRSKCVTKERARELWEVVNAAWHEHPQEFVRQVLEHSEFYERDGYESVVYDFPVGPKQLMEKLFPVLQEQLRKELAAKVEEVA